MRREQEDNTAAATQLVKRENFAVKLRKDKKEQILALKRQSLYGD